MQTLMVATFATFSMLGFGFGFRFGFRFGFGFFQVFLGSTMFASVGSTARYKTMRYLVRGECKTMRLMTRWQCNVK